ncbi:DsbA family protein [Bacterioplanoides sp. SCSIO 12839]|uniref:DsbA family protein n=1 Tax=Bacterioplanoides sp. SCSIO 12839 TaxID=2829569 RepID=UPI002105D719|nr:DsbA family protein [Bacterioplanoides sp. SCSIO 12839]UTW47296.1 DsbA family protein [Bacterioplanoides sp. SCSIO 12839]
MSLKNHIQRHAARALSSRTLKRVKRTIWQARQALMAGQPQVDVWLRADDPYSYLLAQVLPQLQQDYAVNWRFRVIATLQDDMYPEPEMWQRNAVLDAGLLASLYQLQAPEIDQPSIAQVEVATGRLLQLQQTESQIPDWQAVIAVFQDLWSGTAQEAQPLTSEQQALLARNEAQLLNDGHYLSATLKFQGEWYWGLDRLDHFEQRLNDLKLNSTEPKVYFDKTYADFCRAFEPSEINPEHQSQPLTLYFSARSPYSYLGLERSVKLAQHYGIPFELKPVLPMIMRGLTVPDSKKFYIFGDTKREADKFGLDYGFVADPLGAGVQRCYALFDYARSQAKEVDFMLSFARAVNAEGIMAETDSGMKKIVERAGLNWTKAAAILAQDDWQTAWLDWAEANRLEMIEQGQWGVPSIRYGDLTVWGQDRIEFIEQAIRRHLGLKDD